MGEVKGVSLRRYKGPIGSIRRAWKWLTSSQKSDRRIAQVLGLPALLLVIAFIAAPILFVLVAGFRDVTFGNILSTEAPFIGLDNYAELFGESAFRWSVVVTFIFGIGSVVGAYTLGLIGAILLDRSSLNRGVVFILMLLPWAMPAVPAGMIWRWMLDRNYGITNQILEDLGLIQAPLEWMLNPGLALLSIIVVSVWNLFPIAFILLFAGLQSIPTDLYESAKLDGASAWQEVRHVSLPSLQFVTFTLVVLLTLFSLRSITSTFVMTGGGPGRSTEVLALFTFLQAFEHNELGVASAAAVVTMGIIVLVTLAFRLLLPRTFS
jgi:multiple sugar transport system permease protein